MILSRLSHRLVVLVLLVSFTRPASVLAEEAATHELVSHRAIYDLALTRAAEMDGVRAAKGSMVYALTDRCEGYTIESNLQMELAFANGVSNQVDQRFASWEAKDGRSATFRMQVLENGLLTKSYHGAAALSADGSGTASYESDAVRTYKLPKGTLLSTAHLIALLKSAAAGEKSLVRPVIDGSFEEGPFTLSAVIAGPRTASGAKTANPKSANAKIEGDSTMAEGRYWPISLAYFPPATEGETPQYEINMNMLGTGVTRSMTEDFGAFTLGFDLVRVEAIAPSPC